MICPDLSIDWSRPADASVNWVIIGSDYGLYPVQHQAISWTNADISQVEPLVTKFNELLIEIQIFLIRELFLQTSSAKSWQFCYGRQRINSSHPSAAYVRQWIVSALVQIMACRLFGGKPLSKLMLDYHQLDTPEQT